MKGAYLSEGDEEIVKYRDQTRKQLRELPSAARSTSGKLGACDRRRFRLNSASGRRNHHPHDAIGASFVRLRGTSMAICAPLDTFSTLPSNRRTFTAMRTGEIAELLSLWRRPPPGSPGSPRMSRGTRMAHHAVAGARRHRGVARENDRRQATRRFQHNATEPAGPRSARRARDDPSRLVLHSTGRQDDESKARAGST